MVVQFIVKINKTIIMCNIINFVNGQSFREIVNISSSHKIDILTVIFFHKEFFNPLEFLGINN